MFKKILKKKYAKTNIERSSSLIDSNGNILNTQITPDEAIKQILALPIPKDIPEIVFLCWNHLFY